MSVEPRGYDPEELRKLIKKVYGDQIPDNPVGIQLRQIKRNDHVYYRAEDVAELLITLGQYRTARHIRENL